MHILNDNEICFAGIHLELILRVLNDEVLRQNIINAGFHTLQSKFNEECYSKKLENVYSNFA